MPLSFPLNDGTTIPALGFGTGTALMHLPTGPSTPITSALTVGFMHFDTAQMYRTEEALGDVLRTVPRSQLYITTKFDDLKDGATVRSSLEGSLARLQLEYVDLFLVHAPAHFKGRMREVWAQMEEVKRVGLARSIGVSNFEIEDFEEFLSHASIPPAINQIELHPYVLGVFEPLLEYTNKHGIVTESYGALAPVTREPGGPLDPLLDRICARIEGAWGRPVTRGQVLMKWVLQKGAVVVTTSSKENRMKEYLDVLDMLDLTGEEISEIDRVGKEKPTGPAGSVGRYKKWLELLKSRQS